MRQDSEKENKLNDNETESNEELKKALEEEKARAEENLAGWQRSQADFINYKRFVEQEKSDTLKYANTNLLCNILPILDDYERALAVIPPEDAKKDWVEGLKMIDRKFRDILAKQGVTCISCLGQEFDPRIMDAVTCSAGKKDVVVEEIEKAYKLQDKLIRPAKVVVGSGEEQADKEE